MLWAVDACAAAFFVAAPGAIAAAALHGPLAAICPGAAVAIQLLAGRWRAALASQAHGAPLADSAPQYASAAVVV